jgi:hypothetical protein
VVKALLEEQPAPRSEVELQTAVARAADTEQLGLF